MAHTFTRKPWNERETINLRRGYYGLRGRLLSASARRRKRAAEQAERGQITGPLARRYAYLRDEAEFAWADAQLGRGAR